MKKQILDPCCGSKMFWFDPCNPCVVYGDQRQGSHVLCDGRPLVVAPDQVMDFRNLPFVDVSFALVVFDPPHLVRAGEKSWMRKKYGALDPDSWREDLGKGFAECWRVLKPAGTLVFKWNETQIKIRDVLGCFSERPLFGHTTTRNLKTHWLVFHKFEESGA